MLRDRAGRYILPGTLVRGRARQSCEELEDLARGDEDLSRFFNGLVEDLFGTPGDQHGAYLGHRGRLSFEDLVCADRQHAGEQAEQRVGHRIRIDRRTRSVAPGALEMIEMPFAVGERVVFRGRVRFFARDDREIERIDAALRAILLWIPQLGAERGVGFGRVVCVDIRTPAGESGTLQEPRLGTWDATVGPGAFTISIRPRGPLCFAKRRRVDNFFETHRFIPGAAVKGTLAAMLARILGIAQGSDVSHGASQGSSWGAIRRHFSSIRFLEARPVKRGSHQNQELRRPIVPPLSLVKVDDVEGTKLYDVALLSGPCLIGGRVPAFVSDWKQSDDVECEFGWAAVGTEVRVRTAIDRATGSSLDEHLFAWEVIAVTEDIEWIGGVDLLGVPAEARAEVFAQFHALVANGLHGLSKTKAEAEIVIADHELPKSAIGRFARHTGETDTEHVIVLQTPALLISPQQGVSLHGKSSDAVRLAYEEILQEHCLASVPGGVKLVRHFATQSLEGGYRRFKYQGARGYEPFLLTNAGSTFVLRSVDPKEAPQLTRCVEGWASRGMPLPRWAIESYGDDWRSNPYRPQDGFGEVAVDLETAVTKKATCDPKVNS